MSKKDAPRLVSLDILKAEVRRLELADDARVVAACACKLCGAPKGRRCQKGTWGHGPSRDAHAERRRDAGMPKVDRRRR